MGSDPIRGLTPWHPSGVFSYPRSILVHPALQELLAAFVQVSVRPVQGVVGVDEGFGLTHGRHVEVGQHIAQMLLRQGGTDGTDRGADDARRFSGPGALAIRARGVVDGVLQYTG